MVAGALAAAVALFASGTLLAGAPAFASAQSPLTASAGYITVQTDSASSPPGNVGLLSFSMVSDMPITSMTVDIVPEGGGTPVLSLPMSDFTVPTDDGDGNFGTWYLTNPITTTQLAIGTYDVEVTAASADASISDVPAGVLGFLNEVSFPTFASSGTSFSYDNQDVTFTGTATVQAPGGAATPFASEPLVLTDNSSATTDVTTASDGSFSVTVPAASEFFWVEYQGDPTTASVSSAAIQLTVTPDPVTVTATLSAQHVEAGQTVNVTGTVTYSEAGVTKPLAGNTVSLYFVQPVEGPQTVNTAVTDANGQFTMAVPTNIGSPVTWYVESMPTTFLSADTVTLPPLTVAQPSLIGDFRASVNAYAIVQTSSCIVDPSGVERLEYAARASGPWVSLGKLKNTNDQCTYRGQSGSEWTGTFGARLASAYYRIVNVASDESEAAASSSIHLARLLTKITSFSVSPREVPRGGKFRVSGRLWEQNKRGKWQGYGGRKVLVIFKYQGTWYRYPDEPRTTGSGQFTGTFRVYDSTPVFAQYDGDATHFACATKRIHITDTGGTATAARPAGMRLVNAIPLAARVAALLLAGR